MTSSATAAATALPPVQEHGSSPLTPIPLSAPAPPPTSTSSSSRRVSFSPFSFHNTPSTATVSSVASSTANRIAGIGKSLSTVVRRSSSSQANPVPVPQQQQQQFAGDRGNVESKEPESLDAASALGGGDPTKKASTLEDENLSKILHRRSRPRSAKLAELVQQARALQEKKEQQSS